MPGLTYFDSVSGVFSLDYPTFFEKIREGYEGFIANIGADMRTDDFSEI